MPDLLDLSSIKLPEEDGKAKADLDTGKDGDEGIVGDPDDAAAAATGEEDEELDLDKKIDVKVENLDDEEDPDKTPPSADAKPDSEEDKDKDPAKPEDKPDKPTPFHEHPDWKKMQEKVNRLEEENQQLKKGGGEKPPENPYQDFDGMSAQQAAVKIVRKEVADGKYKPEDAIEAQSRVREVEADIEKHRSEQQNFRQNQFKTQLTQNTESAFVTAGITDKEQKKAVLQQVLDWEKQGVARLNPDTIGAVVKVAAEHLKATGKLTNPEPPKPAESDESKKKTESVKHQKTQTNNKIKKPKSGDGDSKQNKKKSYASFHNKSLDDIVLDAGKSLG